MARLAAPKVSRASSFATQTEWTISYPPNQLEKQVQICTLNKGRSNLAAASIKQLLPPAIDLWTVKSIATTHRDR
jgi:hypothetical protein